MHLGEPMRHSAIVRATHWVMAAATVALIVSGVAILIAHPRLYWGETGGVGGPSLIDLPIPFLLGHSGWGRYLHFLAAWIAVASGVIYLIYGIVTRHFVREVLPSSTDLVPGSYNAMQRGAYTILVFMIGPLVLVSGLAFSPAIASVMPAVVAVFGGQQSARTIHFFAGLAVVVFFVGHLVMVWLNGFVARTRAMITGRASTEGS